jgi:hypothetical protein
MVEIKTHKCFPDLIGPSFRVAATRRFERQFESARFPLW